MSGDDLATEGEAEALAAEFPRRGTVDLVEAIEDAPQLGPLETDAAVAHRDARDATLLGEVDLHLTGVGELECVAEQVLEELAQGIGIALDFQLALRPEDAHADSLAGELGVPLGRDHLDEVHEVEPIARGMHASAVILRGIDEVGESLLEPLRLVEDHLHELVARLGVDLGGRALQSLGVGLDRGQRCAQLVAHVGDEVFAQRSRLAQLLAHDSVLDVPPLQGRPDPRPTEFGRGDLRDQRERPQSVLARFRLAAAARRSSRTSVPRHRKTGTRQPGCAVRRTARANASRPTGCRIRDRNRAHTRGGS